MRSEIETGATVRQPPPHLRLTSYREPVTVHSLPPTSMLPKYGHHALLVMLPWLPAKKWSLRVYDSESTHCRPQF